MKITTTIEVTKQEKNIIYDAIRVYQDHINSLIQDTSLGVTKTILDEIMATINKLFKEFEQNI